MSGPEIVGTLSAALHLAKIGVEVVERLSDVSRGHGSVESRIVYLEAFIDRAETIKSQTGSQDILPTSVLDESIKKAKVLLKLLRHLSIDIEKDGFAAKLRKSIRHHRKEKRVTALEDEVEQSKSTLQFHLLPAIVSKIQDILLGSEARFSRLDNRLDRDFSKLYKETADIQDALRRIHGAAKTLNAEPIGSRQHWDNLSLKRKFQSFFMAPLYSTHFIGQKAVLERIEGDLGSPTGTSNFALVGFGGAGKSAVALEYACKAHKNSPSTSVMWVRANDRFQFEQDLVMVSDYVTIPRYDPLKPASVLDVKKWLSSRASGKWLMVVDNLCESDGSIDLEVIAGLLPYSISGSILFTTRNRQSALKLVVLPQHIIELGQLSNSDARNLLLSRSGTCGPEDDAKALLGALHFLPLPIVQAGSYITASRCSFSDYLELYRESEANRLALLTKFRHKDMHQRQPDALTWLISFETIQRDYPTATDLLFRMACLDCNDIPKKLLPTAGSNLEFSGSITVLRSFSMIAPGSGEKMVSIRPFVHLETRRWLQATGQFDQQLQLAFDVVFKQFPSQHILPSELHACEHYLSHARGVLFEESSPVDPAKMASLASRVSSYLSTMGRYATASIFAVKALEWNKSTLGPHTTTTLKSLNDLAALNCQLGYYELAQQQTRQVLAFRTELFGEDHKDTLASFNNLGLILATRGCYTEAESTHRRALDLNTQCLGPDHNSTLISLQNLALVLRKLHNFEEAEEIMRKVLGTWKERLGQYHAFTLTAASNLGTILQMRRDYDGASVMYSTAIGGWLKIFGAGCLAVWRNKANLADCYTMRSQFSSAERLLNEVIKEYDGRLGEESPEVWAVKEKLAGLWQQMGKYDEAEGLARRVLDFRNEKFGLEHPDTVRVGKQVDGLEEYLRTRRDSLVISVSLDVDLS